MPAPLRRWHRFRRIGTRRGGHPRWRLEKPGCHIRRVTLAYPSGGRRLEVFPYIAEQSTALRGRCKRDVSCAPPTIRETFAFDPPGDAELVASIVHVWSVVAQDCAGAAGTNRDARELRVAGCVLNPGNARARAGLDGEGRHPGACSGLRGHGRTAARGATTHCHHRGWCWLKILIWDIHPICGLMESPLAKILHHQLEIGNEHARNTSGHIARHLLHTVVHADLYSPYDPGMVGPGYSWLPGQVMNTFGHKRSNVLESNRGCPHRLHKRMCHPRVLKETLAQYCKSRKGDAHFRYLKGTSVSLCP